LIAARALQGVGAAFVMPLSLALLGTAFPPERRGSAMGFFVALAGLAVLCGPLLGGAVVQGLSWPWIFWLSVPIAIVLTPLSLSRIPESYGLSSRIDLPGLACGRTSVRGRP
jgi:MFS family permease